MVTFSRETRGLGEEKKQSALKLQTYNDYNESEELRFAMSRHRAEYMVWYIVYLQCDK